MGHALVLSGPLVLEISGLAVGPRRDRKGEPLEIGKNVRLAGGVGMTTGV